MVTLRIQGFLPGSGQLASVSHWELDIQQTRLLSCVSRLWAFASLCICFHLLWCWPAFSASHPHRKIRLLAAWGLRSVQHSKDARVTLSGSQLLIQEIRLRVQRRAGVHFWPSDLSGVGHVCKNMAARNHPCSQTGKKGQFPGKEPESG